MAKRFTATEIWEEDWFLEMPNEYKLFWYYILSKCDHAGIFKVNLRSFTGLIQVNVTSNDALRYFNNGKDRIRIINESLWFIEDFYVYQYGSTFNINNRLHESIKKTMAKYDLQLTSIRGLTDLKDGVKDKDKEIKKGGTGENNGLTDSGDRFDEKGIRVYFKDGTNQLLGMEQRIAFKEGTLRPRDVKRGLTY